MSDNPRAQRIRSSFVDAVQLCFVTTPDVTFQAMADRLGTSEAGVRKLFGATEKWRLDDISDLMMAMGAEIVLSGAQQEATHDNP